MESNKSKKKKLHKLEIKLNELNQKRELSIKKKSSEPALDRLLPLLPMSRLLLFV